MHAVTYEMCRFVYIIQAPYLLGLNTAATVYY